MKFTTDHHLTDHPLRKSDPAPGTENAPPNQKAK